MNFRFEKLHVWQDSRNFINNIYTITRQFPTSEKFALVDQLRRAAISIALNIAEGSDRKSDLEFIRYLRMSISSTEEVITALYISLDQRYIKQKDFDKLYQESHMIVAKLNALIKSLQSTVYGLPQKNRSRKTEDGRPSKGFTLIELLVAVAILAVVSTIGIIIFQGAQAKARDAVRKNDLEKLATALEIYLQYKGKYVVNNGSCSDNTAGSSLYTDADFANLISDSLPKDPKSSNPYCYESPTGLTYKLYAKLEDGSDYILASP